MRMTASTTNTPSLRQTLASSTPRYLLSLSVDEVATMAECLRHMDENSKHDYAPMNLLRKWAANWPSSGVSMVVAYIGVIHECVDFAAVSGLDLPHLPALKEKVRAALLRAHFAGNVNARKWVERSIKRENDDRLMVESNYIYAPDDRLSEWGEVGQYATEREFGSPESDPVYDPAADFDTTVDD